MRLVLDSNIVISAVTTDEFTDAAVRLIQGARRQEMTLVGPQAIASEAAHVLLRLHRLRLIRQDAARASYEAVRDLSFLHPYDKPLSREDFELGLQHTIGGSDLLFVRLARELSCPLVTMDRALRTNAAPLVETLDLDGALARLGL